jgi:hypothetical protein
MSSWASPYFKCGQQPETYDVVRQVAYFFLTEILYILRASAHSRHPLASQLDWLNEFRLNLIYALGKLSWLITIHLFSLYKTWPIAIKH